MLKAKTFMIKSKIVLALFCALLISVGNIADTAADADKGDASGDPTASFRIQPGHVLETFGLKRLIKAEGSGPMVFLDTLIGEQAKKPAKALMLSFFASWCEPCKAEFPEIQRLAAEYGEQGLAVLMINIDDTPEGIEKARKFLDKVKPGFPVVSDRFHLVARRFFGDQLPLPANYLVDDNFKVTHVFSGGNHETVKRIEDAIRKELEIKAPEGKIQSDLNNLAPEEVKPEGAENEIKAEVTRTKGKLAWISIGSAQGVKRSMKCSFKTSKGEQGTCSVLAVVKKRTRLKTGQSLKKGDWIILSSP